MHSDQHAWHVGNFKCCDFIAEKSAIFARNAVSGFNLFEIKCSFTVKDMSPYWYEVKKLTMLTGEFFLACTSLTVRHKAQQKRNACSTVGIT